MTTLLVFIFQLCSLIHIFTSFLAYISVTIWNILMILWRIIEQVSMECLISRMKTAFLHDFPDVYFQLMQLLENLVFVEWPHFLFSFANVDHQMKVRVMICIPIVDLLMETLIILYSSSKWLCEVYDWTLSSLILTMTLKMMPWPFYCYQCCNSLLVLI